MTDCEEGEIRKFAGYLQLLFNALQHCPNMVMVCFILHNSLSLDNRCSVIYIILCVGKKNVSNKHHLQLSCDKTVLLSIC